MKVRWTEEETLKFTQLYHENECLWKLSSPNYKSKMKRREAIEKIVNEMKRCFPDRFFGFGDIKAKEKIKNLRCTYNQELSKIKNFKSKSAQQYVPSLKWFVIMDLIVKKSKGPTDIQSTMDELSAELHNCDGNEIDQRNEQTYYEQNTQISYEAEQQEGVLNKLDSFSEGEKSTSGKKKLQDLLCAVQEMRTACKTISGSKQDMSDNEAFGTYVAKCLDRLNPYEAIMCQQEIQKVITQYRLGQAPIIIGHETEME